MGSGSKAGLSPGGEFLVYILCGGMTGLAGGWASGLPVYEAEETSGGICSSCYVRPGTHERLSVPPPDQEAYRFDVGGGQ